MTEVSYELNGQQNGGDQMKEQIKDIDGPGQAAVFQHNQLFNHMRHRTERRQQHKNRYKNQNRIGYAV